MALRELKDAAVREERQWLRLTRRCNNGCLFCLDSECQDGTYASREEVEQCMAAGRLRGADRLILSGGEATLHPEFVQLVAQGRELGYSWVQTVTNGRMFAYTRFADACVEAGLNEATFSMHGHTPDLHDTLVGVRGAFRQSIAGMRNLLSRIVVNVDVVLNRMNIPVLKELLEFYLGLGIREFDLLHMVPFGRAWSENRERLFYDPALMAPYLRKAFALRRRKGVVMWTNRLPAPFLEGCEDLIQDPHKLHDEVRGRLEMFEQWRDHGKAPSCMGERCVFCPMMRYCATVEGMLEGTWEPPLGPARCLAGSIRRRNAAPAQAPPELSSFPEFTEWFIKEAYLVKSLRCAKCSVNESCRGIHIDEARDRGFRILRPLP